MYGLNRNKPHQPHQRCGQGCPMSVIIELPTFGHSWPRLVLADVSVTDAAAKVCARPAAVCRGWPSHLWPAICGHHSRPAIYGQPFATPYVYGQTFETPCAYGTFATPCAYGQTFPDPCACSQTFPAPCAYGQTFPDPCACSQTFPTPCAYGQTFP